MLDGYRAATGVVVYDATGVEVTCSVGDVNGVA
jgi:hypothetical protein